MFFYILKERELYFLWSEGVTCSGSYSRVLIITKTESRQYVLFFSNRQVKQNQPQNTCPNTEVTTGREVEVV